MKNNVFSWIKLVLIENEMHNTSFFIKRTFFVSHYNGLRRIKCALHF